MPTSSIVAIGDELVGGFTLDTNSHWLAERLRLLGYPAKRITAIRDRPQEIVEHLRRELADTDVNHIFCCGGVRAPPDTRALCFDRRRARARAGDLGRDPREDRAPRSPHA